jgi:hypothetical protein
VRDVVKISTHLVTICSQSSDKSKRFPYIDDTDSEIISLCLLSVVG